MNALPSGASVLAAPLASDDERLLGPVASRWELIPDPGSTLAAVATGGGLHAVTFTLWPSYLSQHRLEVGRQRFADRFEPSLEGPALIAPELGYSLLRGVGLETLHLRPPSKRATSFACSAKVQFSIAVRTPRLE